MPSPEAIEESRGKPLLTVLFWVGVGLAPIAALLLLVGDGNGVLRVAAVLALLAVVLIGLSIALRSDANAVRDEIEDILAEEIEDLRADLRKDIESAARATHKAFGEKLHAVQQCVEAIRSQQTTPRPDAGRGEPADVGGHRSATRPAGQYAGTVSSGAYGRAGGHAAMPEADVAGGPGGPASGPPPAARRVAPAAGEHPPRPHLPSGVVQHTETVQVTTRQTIVGPPEHDPGGGNVYGSTVYGGRGHRRDADDDGDWSEPPPRRERRASAGDEDSPPEQRAGEPRGGERGGDRRGPGRYDHDDAPGTGDEGYWSSLRAGGRWASVRSDEHGQELRMGERRAAAHADESGAQLHVEDRWAAVRRSEPRRTGNQDDSGWDEPQDGQRRTGHRASGGWPGEDPGGRGADEWRDPRQSDRREDGDGPGSRGERGGWDRRTGAAALPARSGDPSASWHPGRRESEREPVRSRRSADDEEAYGYPPADDVPRAGGARRGGHGRERDGGGYSDEYRWR